MIGSRTPNLAIIILIPILDHVAYPQLRKSKIEFRPVYRITLGFCLAASAQVVGAILQWRIYETSPCGYHATICELGVSPISAWAEVSLYILQATSECFCWTSAYELAYTRSPPHMKGLLMAIFLFMNSLPSPFAAMAITGLVCAVIFFLQFRNLHHEMEAEKALRDYYVEHDEGTVAQTANDGYRSDKEGLVGLQDGHNIEPVTSIKSAFGR